MRAHAPIALLAFLGLSGCAAVGDTQRVPSAATETTGTLFVANKFGNSLSQIDLATGRELRRIDACANPHELATSPDGQHVALACYGGTRLDLFRTDTLERVKSIELGDNARPHGIVWHTNGDLYSTAEGRKSVFWVRNPLEKAETFEYGTGKVGSHMLAVSPDGNHAWTTDIGSKTVTLVDLKTRRAPHSVEVGMEPEGIALTSGGKTLWVSARGSDRAFALDPMTLEIRSEVATGGFPLRIAIRPQGDVAVTSDLSDATLSVLDLTTGKLVRTITIDDRANAQTRLQVTILWSPDGERIYVAETGTDTVAEVEYRSGKVLRRISTGDGGDGLGIIAAAPKISGK